jgi:hypothetical protein
MWGFIAAVERMGRHITSGSGHCVTEREIGFAPRVESDVPGGLARGTLQTGDVPHAAGAFVGNADTSQYLRALYIRAGVQRAARANNSCPFNAMQKVRCARRPKTDGKSNVMMKNTIPS